MKWMLVHVFLLVCNSLLSQDATLSRMDQRKKNAMVTELNLTESQQQQTDSIFKVFAITLNDIEDSLKTAQRDTTIAEVDLNSMLRDFNQEKKDLRKLRDLELRRLLTPEQVKIHDEVIVPSKPQVLHFGVHNRADCNVCKD